MLVAGVAGTVGVALLYGDSSKNALCQCWSHAKVVHAERPEEIGPLRSVVWPAVHEEHRGHGGVAQSENGKLG